MSEQVLPVQYRIDVESEAQYPEDQRLYFITRPCTVREYINMEAADHKMVTNCGSGAEIIELITPFIRAALIEIQRNGRTITDDILDLIDYQGAVELFTSIWNIEQVPSAVKKKYRWPPLFDTESLPDTAATAEAAPENSTKPITLNSAVPTAEPTDAVDVTMPDGGT